MPSGQRNQPEPSYTQSRSRASSQDERHASGCLRRLVAAVCWCPKIAAKNTTLLPLRRNVSPKELFGGPFLPALEELLDISFMIDHPPSFFIGSFGPSHPAPGSTCSALELRVEYWLTGVPHLLEFSEGATWEWRKGRTSPEIARARSLVIQVQCGD